MVGTTYTYFVHKWNIIVFSFKHLLIHCNGFLIGQSCLNPGECNWNEGVLVTYLSAYLSVWTWCCTLGSVQYLCVCQWRRKQFLNGGSIVFWMEKKYAYWSTLISHLYLIAYKDGGLQPLEPPPPLLRHCMYTCYYSRLHVHIHLLLLS